MTEQVHLPDAAFAHNCLHLAPPNGLQGGAYFAMLYYKDAPLYIQTPKCTSRQAVVPGKRPYIDLMFSSHDAAFLEWLEALEADAIRMIYEKRNVWISGDIEKSDIEAGFTSPVRPYKGGKHYLIRAHIQPSKHLAGTPSCSVFDENERPVSIEHIKAENQMYTVLEFQGIKFTSRSFQFEVALKQVLLVSNVPMFQSCVIRKPSAAQQDQNPIPQQADLNQSQSQEGQSQQDMTQEDMTQEDMTQEDIIQDNQGQTQDNQGHPQDNQGQCQDNQGQTQDNQGQTQDNQGQCQDNQGQTQDNQGQCQEESKQHQDHVQEVQEVQEMQEVNLDVLEELEQMHLKLKKPSEVYYKMYQVAKQKAKELKKNAIAAYLEAKQIKSTHMLEDIDDDSDDSNIYSDSENEDDDDDNNNNES